MAAPIFHMIAGAPRPVAPFSHAVEVDGWVFVTGQMPDTPKAPGALPEGIEKQTRNVMANLETVLRGIGLGLDHVVMARIYLTRFADDYKMMNEVYRSYFPADRLPARTCVGVTGLAYDALVEIDLVCRRDCFDRIFQGRSALRGAPGATACFGSGAIPIQSRADSPKPRPHRD